MPANLTPQYMKAENEFRKAQTAAERMACLEEMLRLIPKHKGTEHLQADLKTKLKEAKTEVQEEKAAPKKTRGYKFPTQGAGQVIIIGAPNSGKSRILADLTNSSVEVADYPYTTHEPSPGMMPWEDAQVQLIDTPPISESHMEPYLTGLVRAADACILCFDGSSDEAPTDTASVITKLAERKTFLADRTGFDEEDLGRVLVNTLLVVTRASDPGAEIRLELFYEMFPEYKTFPVLKVDLDDPASKEEMRNRIYQLLGVIRVYTKRPGKPAEYIDPFTVPTGATVEELAFKIHNDIGEQLKFAKVWGTSAHDGQSVGREHQLADKDMVELHTA